MTSFAVNVILTSYGLWASSEEISGNIHISSEKPMLLITFFIVGIKVENVSWSGGCLRLHNVRVWCMGGGGGDCLVWLQRVPGYGSVFN